jgi:hypothetical protein
MAAKLLHLRKRSIGDIWVNPDAIAYLEKYKGACRIRFTAQREHPRSPIDFVYVDVVETVEEVIRLWDDVIS